MEKLPSDLIVEIFSRLPSKSVARFCTLSKYWDSTLRSQNFAKLFSARSSTRPRLLFAVEQYGYNTWQFFSTPQPQNLYENSSHVDFHSKFSGDISRYICSYASGLFFFPRVQILDEHDPLICNPVTGLYVRLPHQEEYKESRGFLGFDPIDEQFKVIKPYNDQTILTLGTGELSWSSINTTEYFRSLSEGICIDGILYYLSSKHWKEFVSVPLIVCFDVRSEKYSYVNAECFSDQLDPPFGLSLKKTTGFRLVNCKGKLGGIHWKYGDAADGRRTVELYVWVLEDVEKEEWVNYVYTLPENEVLSSCDFSIGGVTATGDIVLVMKFTCNPFYVFYFNPERNSLQSIEIQGFGADLESVENRGQVYAFVDHVEDTSVNNAKQLKSKIAHITSICTCCKEEAKKKKKEEEEEEKKNEEEEEKDEVVV